MADKDDNVRPMPQQGRTVQAAVVPASLWVQIVDLLRDTPFPHKQIDPILQQCSQIVPQELSMKDAND